MHSTRLPVCFFSQFQAPEPLIRRITMCAYLRSRTLHRFANLFKILDLKYMLQNEWVKFRHNGISFKFTGLQGESYNLKCSKNHVHFSLQSGENSYVCTFSTNCSKCFKKQDVIISSSNCNHQKSSYLLFSISMHSLLILQLSTQKFCEKFFFLSSYLSYKQKNNFIEGGMLQKVIVILQVSFYYSFVYIQYVNEIGYIFTNHTYKIVNIS